MKLVFATNNPNKLSELQALVPDGIEILSLAAINCNEELPETNPTLEDNALQKAQYVYQNYGFNCFADDTGLELEALDNAPGVYSARYAGEPSDSEKNIEKILSEMKGKENRVAQFRTVIALNLKNNQFLFEGICKGEISKTKNGNKGFGYDPIFIPKGHKKSFAEMSMDEKGEISHRGKAIKELITFINSI